MYPTIARALDEGGPAGRPRTYGNLLRRYGRPPGEEVSQNTEGQAIR